jgi:hypothetical protein
MANPSNDDVAKALEQLAAGQAGELRAPSDDVSHAAPAPASPPAAPAATSQPLSPVRPAGAGATPKPKPVPGRSAMPASLVNRPLQPPGSAAPPAPRPPGAAANNTPATASRSGAASRPASPGPARPAAPVIASQLASEPQAQVIDDDDRVIVPAPTADVFLHHGTGASARRTPARRLSLRRTLIPILLTAGLILFVLGLLRFLWTENNPLAGLQPWLVVIMFIFALVLWGLAAVNMLAVKQQLASHGR